MTDNQFDDQFRNRLGEYSSQVPEDMWERVRSKKDKNRRGFFFWFRYVILPGCLLVGLAAAYFMHSRPTATSQRSALLQSSAPSQAPNAEPPPSPSAHSPASSSILAPSPSSNPSLESNPSQSPNPSPVSIPARSPIPSPSQSTVIQTTPVQSSRQSSATTHPSHAPELSSDPTPQLSNLEGSTYHPSAAHSQLSTPSFPSADALPAPRRRLSSPSPVSAGSMAIHPLPGLQPIPHSLVRVTAQMSSKKPAALVKGTPAKKDSSVKTHNWYLDVYASPDWPFVSKETPLKMLLSYTAGLKLNRTFGQHFSGTIGLQYSALRSRTPYSDSSLLSHFSSSSIDIPMLIGYHITKKNFGAVVNTGIIFNAKTSGAPYKPHTGFSLYLGFDIAGKINDRMSLFAEPYFRYRLSNMVDDTYSFTSKVHVAGLSAGLRYNFKKSKKYK